MLPYRDSRILKIGLVVFFLLVIGYGYFEARGILMGPSITVTPRVLETTSAYIKIQGTAKRISSLTMNGKAVDVTEDGSFSESYVLVPGYNRIALDAKDKYGKRAERIIEVIYNPSGTNQNPSALPGAQQAPVDAGTGPQPSATSSSTVPDQATVDTSSATSTQ